MFALKCWPLIAVALVAVLPTFETANILVVFPFPGPSQYILVQPYLKALAARGHNLTVISEFPQKQPIENFHDITIVGDHDDYDDLVSEISVELTTLGEMKMIREYGTAASISTLETPAVQALLHSSQKFDLVIVETLFQESLYALGHHFGAPLIGISTFGTDPHIDELVGNISPVSFVPMITLTYTDHMNFPQRLINLAKRTLESIYIDFIYIPMQVEIYRKYFPNPTADLYEVRKNFSLMLLNQHFSLSFPRPYVPNMIEVGGFHAQYTPAKLPADMEAFITSAKHGVIFFSLGSNVKCKYLPKGKLEILLRVFGELKQKVLWKFEEPELPGKPDNVFISKWFPQQDILAHPNVKLFITHGGLLSTIETIYHQKPVVGMPVFYDQHINMMRAINAGIGLRVNFHTFTYDELKYAVTEVLENEKYHERVKALASRFHDQPMKPLDKAIYWTEYVLRHGGAPHMRGAVQDLNFIQKHSLDTAFVLFGGLAAILCLTIWIVWKVLKNFLCGSGHQKQKQKMH